MPLACPPPVLPLDGAGHACRNTNNVDFPPNRLPVGTHNHLASRICSRGSSKKRGADTTTSRVSSLGPLMVIIASLALLGGVTAAAARSAAATAAEYPSRIVLRGGVLLAPPFAMRTASDTDNNNTVGGGYTGFQPDLLHRLRTFAKLDGVDLEFELRDAPAQYGPALDLVANDCNDTDNPMVEDGWECGQFDFIVGDYYVNPDRSLRVDFTPAFLRSTIATLKHADSEKPDESRRTYETMAQLEGAGGTTCVPQGAYLSGVAMDKFPRANYYQCPTPEDCINRLKAGECALYVDDELLLRYRALSDPTLELNREAFNTQYLVWPMRGSLDPTVRRLFKRWMYAAIANASIDSLYHDYFTPRSCGVGTAGPECSEYCDPKHGESDSEGRCICVSTKWTGADCSVEVTEDVNLIPTGLKATGYVMFGTMALAVIVCAAWLYRHRTNSQVRTQQPLFLGLVLLGCLLSGSTILALAQEDASDGTVPACMAAPWLYSVGFCILFGALFAKLWRIRKLFTAAARMKRTTVTVRVTLKILGVILLLDVTILAVWTAIDPLYWTREVLLADKFGEPIASAGYCTSDHWAAFVGTIAALHFILLSIGCYFCYLTRAIPTQFSEGKYISLAMVSNFQIFLIGLPVLIIVGYDSDSSFFVRSAIIWINNMVVIGLIFGHLIHSVHMARRSNMSTRTAIKSFVENSAHGHSQHSSMFPREPDDDSKLPAHNCTAELISAAARGDLDTVRILLRERVVGFSLTDEPTASQVQNGDDVRVDSLAHINDGDYDKRIAIHLAAGEGHADVVRELCVRGADVNAEDRWGTRPLDDALVNGQTECADILRQYGATPGSGGDHGGGHSGASAGDCSSTISAGCEENT